MSYRIGLPLWKLAAKRGVTISVPVDVFFDKEANVYYATSPHLQGLAVEAETLDNLREEVRGAVNVLIELKLGSHSAATHSRVRPDFTFQDQPVAMT